MQSPNCIKCFQPLNGQSVCTHCGFDNASYTPKPQYLPAGTVLNRRYTVGMAMGAGGFGITYAGFDNQLRRRVAIKEYFPSANVWRECDKSLLVSCYNSPEQRESFNTGMQKSLQEAQSLAQLDDIGSIVRVLDFFSENNTAYIIMEFVEGTTLKDYVKQLPSTMSETQITELLLPVMYALKDMHERGFVHRDISPDNIMVTTSKGKAKLLDFGAVKAVSRQTGSATENPVVKRGFSPIELYSTTGLIGPWSDVYALCATVFYLVTGTVLQEPMDRMSNDNPTLQALHGRVSPQMEAVLAKGLAIRPEARYQKMGALINDMEAARKFAAPAGGAVRSVPTGYNIPSSQSPYDSVSASNHSFAPVSGTQTAYGAPQGGMNGQQSYGQQSYQPAQPVYAAPAQQSYQTPAQQPAGNQGDNKKKTGLIIGIGAGVILILLIAIIAVVAKNGKKPDKTDNTTAASDSGKSNDSGAGPLQMSEDPFDFIFTLDGDIYQLPCDLEDFTDNGWAVEDEEELDTPIAGDDDYEVYLVKKGDKQISVFFYNATGNEKKAGDCRIGGIQCERGDNIELEIAKGITLESTADEVLEAYGAPNYNNETDDYTSISYYKDTDTNYDFAVEFFIYNEDSKMTDYSDITLTNYLVMDDDSTETNTEVPAYLSEYKAPKALGTDLKSGIFKLEGDLYQLPCPVTAFIDNGWKISSQDGDLASGNRSYGLKLKKDGKDLSVSIVNLASYQTTPENCAVYSVSIADFEDIDIELPNEIKIGMSKATVETFIDDTFNFYSSSLSMSYTYSEYDERDYSVRISMDPDTKTVDNLSVECETWDY